MKSYALALVAATTVLVAACSRSGPGGAAATVATAKPAEQHHPLTGAIVSVDVEKRTIRVKHEEVKGLMPAMMMDFAV